MRPMLPLLIALSPMALAQTPPGMSEADMQRMMQQMQKAQACMQNIDQREMQRMQQRAQQLNSEIDALCAQGKRDEAERTALAFAREMEASPSAKQMQKCGEMMPDMAGVMPYSQPAKDAPKDSHICD